MSDTDIFSKRIALVVQGPVHSRGKTAANRNKPMADFTEADVVDFDCQDLIGETIEQGRKMFGAAVYVAWSTDDTSKLERRLGSDYVLRIEDKTPDLPPNSKVIASNNKFRQFTAVSAGLQHLQSSCCDFAIKVRGDQRVPLAKLAEWLQHLEKGEMLERRLVVPCFKLGMAFGIEDFYLGGHFKMLQEACKVYLGDNFAEFSRNVHRDLFGKLTRHFLGCELHLPLCEYFIGEYYNPITEGQVKICRAAWNKLFITFPRQVWEETWWRGSPLGKEPLNLYSDCDAHRINQVLDCLQGAQYLSLSDQPGAIEFEAIDLERLSRFVFGSDTFLSSSLAHLRNKRLLKIRRVVAKVLKVIDVLPWTK